MEQFAKYLPVLRITTQHHRILWLADLAGVIVFGVFHVLLSLDTVVFREGARVTFLNGIYISIYAS